MLLRFQATNHLSLRDKQQLSLIASSIQGPEEGLMKDEPAIDEQCLPAVVIYGANASGKSNLIQAMRFMVGSVLYSQTRSQPEDDIPRSPFALNNHSKSQDSFYEIDFTQGGVRYEYGFTCSDEHFTSEWLNSFPKGRKTKLFYRDRQSFSFGRSLKGRNTVVSELTRPNSLFLSSARQNDHVELTQISSIFTSIYVNMTLSMTSEVVSSVLDSTEVDKRTISFLGSIGTGVVSYRTQKEEVPEQVKLLQSAFFTALKQVVQTDSVTIPPLEDTSSRLELAHQGENGEVVYFDLARESSGTRRLLAILGPVFRALDTGSIVVVDELDASLHTFACEAVLALFSNSATNPKGAQLIATTHDTNLLRSKFLRRDQIWFAEKHIDGSTELYPLTDLKTRVTDNIERGYLQGRFGAVPFSGTIEHLFRA